MGGTTHAALKRKLGGSPDASPPRQVQSVGRATRADDKEALMNYSLAYRIGL